QQRAQHRSRPKHCARVCSSLLPGAGNRIHLKERRDQRRPRPTRQSAFHYNITERIATAAQPNKMEETTQPDLDWNLESAELAYGVIARYVEHTQVSGIIIAMLASALDEERVKNVVQSPYWQSYMTSKRSIADAKPDVERLTAMLERMRQSTEP